MRPERFLTLAADAAVIVVGAGGMVLQLYAYLRYGRIDAGVMATLATLLGGRTMVGVWSLRPPIPGESATPASPSLSTPGSPSSPESSPSTPA